jgi:hypothetical protein
MAAIPFEIEAARYWKRNLPKTPVDGKVPVTTGWTGGLGGTPSEQKQAEWLEKYRDKNIGLLLGKELTAGGFLVALDVDDDRLLKVVLEVLGLNRAERRVVLSGKRGKKGATIFVRAPKQLKSTVIKGEGGLGNIDFLAAGKQTVMPPSIHPDTGKPYEVYGKSLLEVDFADLPEFSVDQLKLLRAAIGSEHALALIEGKATHDAGLALVAALVGVGYSDEEITDVVVGLLPDGYSGDSLKELPGWLQSAREKGFDQPEAASKSLAKALVSIVLESGAELFSDGDDTYVTLPHTGQALAYRIASGTLKLWIRHQAHNTLGKPASSGPLAEAIGTLEAIALFDRPKRRVDVRVAGDASNVVVDLGDDEGNIIQIDRDGWRVSTSVPHKFLRGAGFGALPMPVSGGDLQALKDFLGLDDQNYRLLLAFLINALKPNGPYFILLVEGEQGSGKSFFSEITKRMIDPNKAMRLRLPDKPQDLMIQAKEYRLLSFDNASGMKAEMSDALCSLATGGGIAVRKLYSDGDLYVMSYARPFMINGISGYANRPDLMERAIPIKLPPVKEGTRRTEEELLAEFEGLLPGILGALLDAVSYALRVYDDIDPPRHLRMADAARWIKAAEFGLDEKPGAIIDAIAGAQHDFVVDRVNDDPLVMKLRAITRQKPFEDYVGELFVRIVEEQGGMPDRNLPRSPSQLSNQLVRMRPAMEKAGLIVEFLAKDRKGRKVRIVSAPDEIKPRFDVTA